VRLKPPYQRNHVGFAVTWRLPLTEGSDPGGTERVSVDSADDSEAVTQFHDPLLLRARSRVGTVLREKWRLDALLGVGGMAAVYAATHRNGSRVAVKILHPELSLNAQVKTRFLREGYVSNSVGHEGAVRVSDDDTADDGSAFLVMDLLDGETLEDRRGRFGGRLPEDDVLSVAEQLLDVLAAAHAKGIVHRDLKPENVFLTRAGKVKVLDFGIARIRELSTASTATRGGSTMGTPAFMPPEQARGRWEEVDAQSDLWASGALMFTLLTGRQVHEASTSNEQLLSAMTLPAPPLSTILPNVGVAVAHVVDRALAFEKDKRWRDAHRMQEAVRRAYNDRNHAPITTAPRLTVPETVPDRTVPSAGGPGSPGPVTTGRPVVGTRISWVRPSRATVGAGGALAIAVVGIILVVAAGHSSKGPTALSSALPAASASATAATVIASVVTAVAAAAPPPPPEAPAVAATDLPVAPSTQPVTWPATSPKATSAASVQQPTSSPPKAMPGTAQSPAAIPTPPPAKMNCSPPFTVDSKGIKKWKAECL
jgi:serine/threonine protein kinase